jgi:hypothetical protein
VRYLILAAIVIAGGVVVVDSIRQRRALRRIVPVQTMVATALGRRPAARPGPLAVPEATDDADADLWGTLAERVDPEAFVPLLAPGTEVKTFRLRWGNDYAIAARPDHRMHFELQP